MYVLRQSFDKFGGNIDIYYYNWNKILKSRESMS